ncbi:hypothetical protein HMPREF3048_01550 [Corynebacterium sp. HMSC075D04]|uniref:S1 family peptidase n=1 Tax=Corynebacterium sp. HMSC075D04 TaxID=1739540 RepID=UPI0008A4B053|nr:serine protease [Corynebacterium sp. HMSC075D04]OFO36640.1 hypothetical protein HMPREF3048_01550 [Corynebacterium sp. HMSC075D04]
MSESLARSIARISKPGRSYCSGALITPDTVLTCAHFFRGVDESKVRVRIDDTTYRLRSAAPIPGTDIALARLTERSSAPLLEIGAPPKIGASTLTVGFGGRAKTPQGKPGLYLGKLPFSASRSFATRIRPAGLVYASPPAIKGDSGGPVFAHGKVFAVQSLIMDPMNRNLRIATVSLLPASYR